MAHDGVNNARALKKANEELAELIGLQLRSEAVNGVACLHRADADMAFLQAAGEQLFTAFLSSFVSLNRTVSPPQRPQPEQGPRSCLYFSHVETPPRKVGRGSSCLSLTAGLRRWRRRWP